MTTADRAALADWADREGRCLLCWERMANRTFTFCYGTCSDLWTFGYVPHTEEWDEMLRLTRASLGWSTGVLP